MTMRTGSSFQIDPGGLDCRRARRLVGTVDPVGASSGTGVPSGSWPGSSMSITGGAYVTLPRACPRAISATGGRVLALLLDAGLLAAEVAQVVELGAPHITARHDLDLLDDRCVQREGALDADAVAHLADREGLAYTRTLQADDDTLEHLDPGLVALDDSYVDLERVAGSELREVGAQRAGVEEVERVHGWSLPAGATGHPRCGRTRRCGYGSEGANLAGRGRGAPLWQSAGATSPPSLAQPGRPAKTRRPRRAPTRAWPADRDRRGRGPRAPAAGAGPG